MIIYCSYVKGTNRKYIINTRGQVFSSYSCNYLQPSVINKYYVVVLIVNCKMKLCSIKSLLKENFPNIEFDKSVYMTE